MKRVIAAILTLILLLSASPGLAFRGIYTDETQKQLNDWYGKVCQKKLPILAGNPAYEARLVFAIYQGENDKKPKTSLEDRWHRLNYFSDIDSAWLAFELEEASTLVLIYPTYQALDVQQGGGKRTHTQVSVVDLTGKKTYAAFTVCSEDPPQANGASDENGDRAGEFYPQKAIQAVADKLKKLNPYADKALYNQAVKLYKAQKYYSAREAFEESEWGDWEKKAKACVQKFPGNKQIWRSKDKAAKGSAVKLTIRAKGIPSSQGTVIMIYTKAGKPISYVFIKGGGKATVKLPTGTFMIKMGIGKTWYGVKELFGPDGDYMTMLFNGGKKYATLKRGAYNLTFNVSNGNVESESESWNNVKQ